VAASTAATVTPATRAKGTACVTVTTRAMGSAAVATAAVATAARQANHLRCWAQRRRRRSVTRRWRGGPRLMSRRLSMHIYRLVPLRRGSMVRDICRTAGPSAAWSAGLPLLHYRRLRRRQGVNRVRPLEIPTPRNVRRRTGRAAIANRASGTPSRCFSRAASCGAGHRLRPQRPDLGRSHRHRSALQGSGSRMARRRVDFAAGREDVLWNDRGKAAIGELRVRHLRGEPSVARKLDGINACDVAAVDRTDIRRIGAVARPIDLAGGERKPAELRSDRPGDVQPRASAAKKADKRRRIDRGGLETAGNPAPALTDESPTSVVRRRKPPRGVVDPGPTPWLDPGPAALV
jgi:hypothetical protein